MPVVESKSSVTAGAPSQQPFAAPFFSYAAPSFSLRCALLAWVLFGPVEPTGHRKKKGGVPRIDRIVSSGDTDADVDVDTKTA